ncbi:putative amino-acid permease [Penicillium oxalicum]|uniref:putative amino-acid permease n=1 Tax=Penicillium oxalicum TaxID=69781 RepID=UPI0020B86729|nr:putative amino-acid permease [Penicillium oxalicum]KAI2786263.1 putative amino-acid permease [Penicillium oxalicum]
MVAPAALPVSDGAKTERDLVTSKTENRVAETSEDDRELLKLGYRAVLARGWGTFDNFACSFSALYCIGGIRVLFYIALSNGGPAALWSSWISGSILSVITAACLAEACSAYPAAGSIYYWAFRSWGGGRLGRFISYLIAAWTLVAWTAFLASDSFGVANYLLSEIVVFSPETTFPISTSDVKARAIAWAFSLAFLALATALNFLPPRMYAWVFRTGFAVIVIDMLLNFIWLPIGVSKTYGFQSAEYVFTTTYNGEGTAPGLNWVLSWFLVSSCLVGEDASGHVAEETISAKKAAAKGVFWSTVASALCGFPIIILFLFCMPPIETFYNTTAPQPFINMYALALGPRAHVVMTIVSMIGAILNTSISLVAVSRLVFAVARDGVFPFSDVLSRVSQRKQPRNAVIFIAIIAALLLCTQLPSQVAFSSLVSTSAAGSIAAYGLVGIGRAFITRGSFRPGFWDMGWFGVFAAFVTFVWNTFAFAVLCAPQYPNNAIDQDPGLFNYAIVIMGGVTVIAVFEWWRKSKNDWFRHLETPDTPSDTDTVRERDAAAPFPVQEAVV